MGYLCDQTGANTWTCYQPDGRADFLKVESGGATEAPTHSCQFWVEKLPKVCKHWDGSKLECGFEFGGETDIEAPSGYNYGQCNGIGRKAHCNQYDADAGEGEDSFEDGYVCVAPSMELSGLGKLNANVKNYPVYERIPPSGIAGYNPDADNVGQCDGHGLGCGADYYGKSIEELKTYPRICNYYRPFSMGFGSKEPQQYIKSKDGTLMLGDMLKQVTYERDKRLPFHFKMYNLRARCMKCAHWDQDTGTDFIIDPNSNARIILTGEPFNGTRVTHCKCSDTASDPYRNVSLETDKTTSLLKRVWSDEANSIICNGAKPECPCYTGEWIYNIDEKVLPGMRIEAEQLLEIRFWLHNWRNQEEYERFFEEIPGTETDDPTTADIYTFSKWDYISPSDPGQSIMSGKKIKLCMPANPANRTFDKETYMSVEKVVFPKAYAQRESTYRQNIATKKGTATANQVGFPTLVRDLSVYQPIPLEIAYPYFSKDPFDRDYGCNGSADDYEPCVKRNNILDNDELMVVGFTVREKPVYVVNLSFTEDRLWVFDEYSSSFVVEEDRKNTVFNAVDYYVESLKFNDVESNVIYSATSDEYGNFMVGPVQLKYGQLNTLAVIVNVSGVYEFRLIDVWCQWQGGLLTQTKFEKVYEDGDGGYIDGTDQFLIPPGTVQFQAYPLPNGGRHGCSVGLGSVIPFHKRTMLTLYDTTQRYNYVVKKKTVTSSVQLNWIRVGNAGRILIEIDDINLNYIFAWEVDEVRITIPANEVNNTPAKTVEFEVVYPEPGVYKQQQYLSRNAVVVAPKSGDPIWVAKESAIIVDYWYEFLDTTDVLKAGEEIVYPDLDDDSNTFSQSSMSISDNTISNITSSTPAVLGMFVDEYGALVSAFATKFLVDVVTIKCRSVEAMYSWKATGTRMQLEPAHGFVLDAWEPTAVRPETKSNTPLCGDHELMGFTKAGPMWFPFSACLTTDYYDIRTSANYCTLPIEGPTTRDPGYEGSPFYRLDYRACGPDKNYAYIDDFGSIYDCSSEWIYHYTVTDSPVFTGWGRYSAGVDEEWYAAMGWSLPPFGNVPREMVERFLSSDHISYESNVGGELSIENGWMPLVPESSMFDFTFNSLSNNGDVYTYGDPEHVSQINFFRAGNVSEIVDISERFRFDEVLETRIERRVAYPGSATEDHRGYFYSMYNFVHDDTAWVWRELHRDIDRGLNGDGSFKFLVLSYQSYEYDMYKTEYKRTVDEGEYELEFTAPVLTDEGEIETYPSLRLGDGPPRYFEIIYDEYDNTQITWMDENEGESDGSGGEGEDDEKSQPYEKTKDRDVWFQDDNILLVDPYYVETSDAEDAEQNMILSYDYATQTYTEKYYNLGVVANIAKDKLINLPMTSSEIYPLGYAAASDMTIDPGGNSSSYRWFLESENEVTLTFLNPFCPSKIVILGDEGVDRCVKTGDKNQQTRIEFELNRPGVKVETDYGVIAQVLPQRASVNLIRNKKISPYTISLDCTVDPKAMTVSRTTFVKVTLTNLTGAYTKLWKNSSDDGPSITCHAAEYRNKKETVKLWERKYLRSVGENFGDTNLNGPEKVIAPRFGFKSGGLYWPEWSYQDSGFAAQDKVRSAYAGVYYHEDETIPIWSLPNEVEPQMTTYDAALELDELGDERSYTFYLPPGMAEFLADANVSDIPSVGFQVTNEKLPFLKHYLTLDYTYPGHEPWQPLGHLYRWGDTESTKCYWFGPYEDIVRAEFVHVHLDDSAEPSGSIFDAFNGVIKGQYITGRTIIGLSRKEDGVVGIV